MKAKKISRTVSISIVCIILGLALSWQFQSIRNNAKVLSLEIQKKNYLIVKILNEQKNNENLKAKISDLQTQLEKLEKASNSEENMKILVDEIQNLRTVAGLTEVKGEGVIVSFSKEDSLKLEDDNLLSILNELRVTNAQALAINDQRVIATTEIRKAGVYIMVNGRHLVPPYEIKAIVDPENAESALNMIGGAFEAIRGFVEVKVEKSDDIVIPKVSEELIKTGKMEPVETK